MSRPTPVSVSDFDTIDPPNQPMFRAIVFSTKAIVQILKCINFAPKVHVRLCRDGIRFMADSSRVMQGMLLFVIILLRHVPISIR